MKLYFFIILFSVCLLTGCPGGGGSAGVSVKYVDGWPIYAAIAADATSSYANKNMASLTNTKVIPPSLSNGETVLASSVTFGDFFQEGQFSAFVVSSSGNGYFLRWRTADSTWVDDTARLLGSSTSGRAVCSASFSITADFNQDGLPDVFMACTNSSDKNLIISNQTTGAYKVQSSGISVPGQRAAAGLIDSDQILDIVVTQVNAAPLFYKGSLDATTKAFSLNAQSNWLGTSCASLTISEYPSNIDSVFLIPIADAPTAAVAARVDLIMGGTSANGIGGGKPYMWLRNKKSSPYFTNCNSNSDSFSQVSDSANNRASLTDATWNNNLIYLFTQSSSAAEVQLSRFSYSNITVSNTSSYNISAKDAVSRATAASDVAKQFKYNSSVNKFQAFDAGCTTALPTRCAMTFSP